MAADAKTVVVKVWETRTIIDKDGNAQREGTKVVKEFRVAGATVDERRRKAVDGARGLSKGGTPSVSVCTDGSMIVTLPALPARRRG